MNMPGGNTATELVLQQDSPVGDLIGQVTAARPLHRSAVLQFAQAACLKLATGKGADNMVVVGFPAAVYALHGCYRQGELDKLRAIEGVVFQFGWQRSLFTGAGKNIAVVRGFGAAVAARKAFQIEVAAPHTDSDHHVDTLVAINRG